MIIDKACAFDPVHTFECGQCFRWNLNDDGSYTGISSGKVCRIANREIICNEGDEEYWNKYFAFDIDYNEIQKELLKKDDKLSRCIEFGSGIRILQQDVWETIVSFIISANNNIPRIKRIIETMCGMFGDEIEFEGKVLYSFPSAKRMAELSREDLAPLRAGYRDTYILDAAKKVADEEVNPAELLNMTDEEAKKTLMKIKGVGSKVADCIMLFSLRRFSVFPKDVWIKRILTEVYGILDKETDLFVNKKYGSLAGFAQQYLYYYYRSLADKTV